MFCYQLDESYSFKLLSWIRITVIASLGVQEFSNCQFLRLVGKLALIFVVYVNQFPTAK